MRRVPKSPLALGALVALVACGHEAEVPESALVPTGDTLLAPQADASAAAWLGGRRWALVSPQDRAVVVADFDRRTVRPLATAGAFEQPYDLFRAGDTLYVSDWQRRRTTGWDSAGHPAGELVAVAALRGALPRARDAAGRWWFEQFPLAGPDGRGNLDSAFIVRMGPDLARGDSMARLSPLDLAEVMSEGRTRLERRLLSGQDRWGVLPDGSLWLARVGKNRVDWLGPDGSAVRGDPLPDQVLPVTQSDRDIFLARFDEALRATVEQVPFAAIKPPFESALAGPLGQVWLVKNRTVGDSIRYYQVVDRQGRLIHRHNHPGLGQVIAFGDHVALVEEHYEKGLRLILFRIPG
jgi:hypothetical protein